MSQAFGLGESVEDGATLLFHRSGQSTCCKDPPNAGQCQGTVKPVSDDDVYLHRVERPPPNVPLAQSVAIDLEAFQRSYQSGPGQAGAHQRA
jgi:hypothetical protein